MKKAILILCFISWTVFGYTQSAPTVSNVQVLGSGLYNTTPNPDQFTVLYGSYIYDDVDNDPENGSTYLWLRNGASTGVTTKSYTLTLADAGAVMTFQVTPVNATTPTTGTTVTSGNSVTVATTTYTNYSGGGFTVSSGTNNYLNAAFNNGSTLTVDGASTVLHIWGDLDATNGLTINVTNGGSLYVHGNLQTNNNVSLNISSGSVFEVMAGLDVKNGSSISISGTATITGDVTVVQNAIFNIASGGSLAISGSLAAGSNADVNISGDMSVSGNVAMTSGDIFVDAGASLAIGGDFSSTGTTTLSGTGPVSVGGTVTGITDSGTVQLPVELVSFTALYIENYVQIIWSTASEINNNYFIIEYSVDAQNWNILAQVAGNGNSTELLNYHYQHFTKSSNYYRLKQVDFDGKSETFKPVFVSTPYISEDASYQVYDIMGKYVMTGTYQEFVNKIKLQGQYILKNNTDCHKVVR